MPLLGGGSQTWMEGGGWVEGESPVWLGVWNLNLRGSHFGWQGDGAERETLKTEVGKGLSPVSSVSDWEVRMLPAILREARAPALCPCPLRRAHR